MSAFELLVGLHVVGGTLALLLGPVPMLAKKGGRVHRQAGFAFCAAMAFSAVSAFVLALIVHSHLLLTIAVLTGFLIFSGLRAQYFRRGGLPGWADSLLCMLLAGFGIWLFWRSYLPLDITGLFFGAGSVILAARQWRMLRAARPDWLLAHIAGMGGSYVATVTAFLVVNVRFLPTPVVFIVPPMIGTLLITWTSIRYAGRAQTQMGRA